MALAQQSLTTLLSPPPFKTFSHSLLALSAKQLCFLLSHSSLSLSPSLPLSSAMEPCLDDLADDLQSLSFTSTTTTNTTTTKRSTSSCSESTLPPSASSSARLPASVVPKSRPQSSSSDPLWSAIYKIRSESPTRQLSLSDLKFAERLGSGDIGSVYLAELKSPGGVQGCIFAAKVMDKKELISRRKEGRARTEREILEMLEHPFLPTLYANIDAPNWFFLLTEFCPGGDLHVLRQRQPLKRFDEPAVRFYASEVIVALEYLHMMGIVYRDLKPENVLVRSDGHIMLTDFDLSLKCDDGTSTPQIISTQNTPNAAPQKDYSLDPPPFASSSCILPSCMVPSVSCFHPKNKRKKKQSHKNGPEFVSEPVDVRSMSFVGTHEYLAPEIVSGEGHGSAVDWWTLGIFIFELFYGVTPFRGVDNELTLANIVARALELPKEPAVPATAKDLISQLLVKDPARRLGSLMGASAVKRHPFFQGVNWALLRCTPPPFIPPPFSRRVVSGQSCSEKMEYY